METSLDILNKIERVTPSCINVKNRFIKVLK